MSGIVDADDDHVCNRCKQTISGLDNYVAHRKKRECLPVQGLDHLAQPLPGSSRGIMDTSFGFFETSTSTGTATEALASEAAFMENIGLYLTPKPKLQLNFPKKPQESNKSQSNWEEDLMAFDWPGTDQEDASKQDPRPTASLLSFLNKPNKSKDGKGHEDQENPETLYHRWRLWHPEQEHQSEEMWDEVLESLESVSNDPTIMEMSSAVFGKLDESAEEIFHCKECDRKLSTLKSYEKHLRSELHFKRSSNLGRVEQSRVSRNPARLVEEDNRRSLPVNVTLNPKMITCGSCNSVVERIRFGKHLISHYHHHRSKDNVEKSKQLVLENIDAIVKEAPYQCDVCRFYCNWDKELVSHWKREHLDEQQEEGSFWCSFCRHYSQSSSSFLDHLESTDHQEIVSVINRSVPMHVRKVNLHRCKICGSNFRLRFTYRKHMKGFHKRKDFELADHEKLKCGFCNYQTFSDKGLTSHKILAHPEEFCYSCKICRLQFRTKELSIRHRKSKSHRENLKKSKGEIVCHRCEICGEEFQLQDNLDDHTWESHPLNTSQCGKCGDRFVNPQSLGAHVKSSCGIRGKKFQEELICRRCDVFSTSKSSMLFFHESLVHESKNEDGEVTCTICQVGFPRPRLFEHILTHAKSDVERCDTCYKPFLDPEKLRAHISKIHSTPNSFGCKFCGKIFGTKRLKMAHQREIHGGSFSRHCVECDKDFTSIRSHREHFKANHSNELMKCKLCNFSTTLKAYLRKHMDTHLTSKTLKCDLCSYTCKRGSELNRHSKRVHHIGEVKHYSCSLCSYKTTSKQHLERHNQSVHGEKKFGCRFCEFKSKTMENLRKHIIKTKSHPGKFVYECGECEGQFCTNDISEFKLHLAESHRYKYPTTQVIREFLQRYFIEP